MIYTKICIRRGATPECVESYLKELEQYAEELEKLDFTYTRSLFGSKDLIDSLKKAVQEEINYCKFNLDSKKRMAEPNFNKWVCTTNDVSGRVHGMFETNQIIWEKSNGRLKATITIKKETTTSVAVKIQNDNPHIVFLNIPYGGSKELVPAAHLKNQKSIEERVETLKRDVDKYLDSHLMPENLAEQNELEFVKKMLLYTEAIHATS